MSSPAPLIEMRGIVKSFPGVKALRGVKLSLGAGEVLALLGENGAGKSTLVKCIMGYHAADEGDIIVDGASRDIRSPHDAYKLGIGLVYQHFTVVPAMTVAENLLLPRPALPRINHWTAEYKRPANLR